MEQESKGDLGVKLASELALPAYLSSACATESLVQCLLPENLKTNGKPFYEEGCEE